MARVGRVDQRSAEGLAMTDSFGYRPNENPTVSVAAIQVSEGKHAETLQPQVLVFLRVHMDPQRDAGFIELRRDSDPELDVPAGEAVSEQLAIPLSLEHAEFLRDQLDWAIGRAREKHWED